MRRLPAPIDEQDQWVEHLSEVISNLIEERKFSGRDAKEARTLINILEAHNWRAATTEAFNHLKILYIANTKGW